MFIGFFNQKSDLVRAEIALKSKKQGEDSIENYFWGFSKLCKKAGMMISSDMKSRWFIDELKPEIRRHLIGKSELSFQDLYEQAKLLETIDPPRKSMDMKPNMINAIAEKEPPKEPKSRTVEMDTSQVATLELEIAKLRSLLEESNRVATPTFPKNEFKC